MKFCQAGNTCIGCPSYGMGMEIGLEVADTVTATIEEQDMEIFRSGTLAQQRDAVKESSKFTPEVARDGAPFMTVVGAVRRIIRGECSTHNI